jgi:hypothetical protein
LCRADNSEQFAYSLSRFEKIVASRYKGWSLAIPEEFVEYVKEHAFHRHWYRDYVKGFYGGESLLKPKGRMATLQ